MIVNPLIAMIFESELFFETILEMLRLCSIELVIPFYTWFAIIVGVIVLLIPSCRKYWWIPLTVLLAAGVICIYLVGPLNSLSVAAQAYWFISVAICLSYGYLIAIVILGMKKLVVWAMKKLRAEK